MGFAAVYSDIVVNIYSVSDVSDYSDFISGRCFGHHKKLFLFHGVLYYCAIGRFAAGMKSLL